MKAREDGSTLLSDFNERGILFNIAALLSFQQILQALEITMPCKLKDFFKERKWQRRLKLLKRIMPSSEWSLMTDLCLDLKQRNIMNILYVSSKDCLLRFLWHLPQEGSYIYSLINQAIKNVGQIVTELTLDDMVVTNMLVLKRHNIYWTRHASMQHILSIRCLLIL